MPRPGTGEPRLPERTDTFVAPVSEDQLLQQIQPAPRGRRSAFDKEREENPTARGMSPWRMWKCLNIDGVETGHTDYEFISPLGGHPRCPECRSPYAMPVDAYEQNARNAKRKLDMQEEDW